MPLFQGLRLRGLFKKLGLAIGFLAFVIAPEAASAQEVALQSQNFPNHYVRHSNFLGFLNELREPIDFEDAKFNIRPGLSGAAGSISFESVNFPGRFLRHEFFRISLMENDGSGLFRQDATFMPRPGLADPGKTSFESVNFPGHFIRHQNFEIWLAQNDNSDLFRQDATFRQLGPREIAALPGRHTMRVGVTADRHAWQDKTYSSTCGRWEPLPSTMAGMVGWGQAEIGWLGENCWAFVLERAVQFDRSLLDLIPDKMIERVVLSYEEAEAPNCNLVYGYTYRCWQNGEGNYEQKNDGCAVARVPSADWVRGTVQGRVPTFPESQQPISRINAQQWDVTSPVAWQLNAPTPPLGIVEGVGIVLTGGPSLSGLTAQDNTVCVSELRNIAFEVTYNVQVPGVFVEPR